MAFLSTPEAVLKLGYSVELIEYFIKKCPKKGEARTLPATTKPAGTLFDEDELLSFQRYLNQPWPKGKEGGRDREIVSIIGFAAGVTPSSLRF